MALKITWTPQALQGLGTVVDYLEAYWTFREVKTLQENISQLTKQISEFPNSCPTTSWRANLHKGLVDKNNYIIYRVNLKNSTIEILYFRGAKQKDL
jgi:plasmid stabilization system protein ParE